MTRPFDLVVYGASGFTGRLVAQHLQTVHGRGLRWALAGRQLDRLAGVRRAIGASESLPLLQADAQDRAALDAMVRQARVVISTVGPYTHHGEPLASACAAAGTDYVDLCGEPLWMADMIARLQGAAAASGSRITFSCGFDSIPFDLGVVFLQQAMQQRFGHAATEVRARVTVLRGTASGGTAASLMATLEAIDHDPALARTMADPYALVRTDRPGFVGVAQPADDVPGYDDWARAWCGPFLMAPINTKNVHRTHALRGHPWGADFRYSECRQTGTGVRGHQRAAALARQTWLQNRLLGNKLARTLISRFALPKPGQGPSAAQREAGRFEVVLHGQTAAGERLAARVRGDRDPGYGSTSQMVAEAALGLAWDVDRRATPGGLWTPGAALGLALVRRLHAHTGVSFELLD